MKIWLLERDDRVDYDEYDSAVVVAPTEEAARNTHPNGESVSAQDKWSLRTWVAPDRVKVTLIGTTSGSGNHKARVICSSFNAG